MAEMKAAILAGWRILGLPKIDTAAPMVEFF
jgi:hypothetical protein